jgi:RNA polymerase sigma factor (sigma-70 family)
MSTARPAAIVRQLEQSVLPGEPTGDRELLDRFARLRDQSAFALIVRRHGPVVLSVCRRVTAHPQDAEDAFQAVFLVLAKKAAALRNPELLGNWLYGVAVRVAGKARRSAARRRAREVQVSAMPDPSTTPPETTSDLGPVLHEELAGLPGYYREPIVLCDLRGASRADAARALGIPEGTLSSRLASGRKKLADRLTRRGVALSAAAVPAALAGGPVSAAVPDTLVAKTCGLVADWAAGSTVPVPVARLADGGFPLRKLILIGMFTTALAAGGAVVAAQADDPADPSGLPNTVPVRLETAAAPAPDPDAKASAFTTAPRLRMAIDLPVRGVNQAVWSPDGKSLAVRYESWTSTSTADGRTATQKFNSNTLLVVPNVFEPNPQPVSLSLEKEGRLVGFTPDGKQLITELREYDLVSGFHKLQFWEVRSAAPPGPGALGPRGPGAPSGPSGPPPGPGASGPGPLGPGVVGGPPAPGLALVLVRTLDLEPDPTYEYAFAPDGKTFRTVYREVSRSSRTGESLFTRLEVREVSAETGRTLRTLAKVDGEYKTYTLAANGKRLAVVGPDAANPADETPKDKLTVWDVETGKKSWVYEMPPQKEQPDDGGPFMASRGGDRDRIDLRFSPDGRRIACFRDLKPTVVMDADKGDRLPAPEQGEHLIATPQFTGDARLLVASGSKPAEHRLTVSEGPFGPGGFGGGGPGGGAGFGNPNVGGKAKGKGGGPASAMRQQVSYTYNNFLGVWDAATGKRLKSWDRGAFVAAHPTRPVVAILESNGSGGVRLGLWDFALDMDRK